MNKICTGCGALMQSSDEDKIGYVPLVKLDTAKECMRCFRMKHYGEEKSVSLKMSNKNIIDKINKDNRFVIFLTDFLNINDDVINLFNSIKNDKLLVINKCELLSKNVNRDNFLKFVKDYYKINAEVKIKGGNINHGAKSILNYLERENIKDAYLVGATNSGKSSLINDLLDINKSHLNKVTVNHKKNTTLDFIKVKINDNLTLYDSPGFVFDNNLISEVGKDVKEYSFNMKKGEALSILDKKYFIVFLDDTKIVFYTNTSLNNKKYFKDLDLEYELTINDYEDLIINGLGFIRFKNKANIKTNIEHKYMSKRSSFLGGNYE